MTAKARTAAEVASLHAECLYGATVSSFAVFGINSLKSMDVPLDALKGQIVGAMSSTGEATFELVVGEYVMEVDLQRTGRVVWLDTLAPWSFGKPSMPTGQLILYDGGGINFAEPAKTKRITFRLRPA